MSVGSHSSSPPSKKSPESISSPMPSLEGSSSDSRARLINKLEDRPHPSSCISLLSPKPPEPSDPAKIWYKKFLTPKTPPVPNLQRFTSRPPPCPPPRPSFARKCAKCSPMIGSPPCPPSTPSRPCDPCPCSPPCPPPSSPKQPPCPICPPQKPRPSQPPCPSHKRRVCSPSLLTSNSENYMPCPPPPHCCPTPPPLPPNQNSKLETGKVEEYPKRMKGSSTQKMNFFSKTKKRQMSTFHSLSDFKHEHPIRAFSTSSITRYSKSRLSSDQSSSKCRTVSESSEKIGDSECAPTSSSKKAENTNCRLKKLKCPEEQDKNSTKVQTASKPAEKTAEKAGEKLAVKPKCRTTCIPRGKCEPPPVGAVRSVEKQAYPPSVCPPPPANILLPPSPCPAHKKPKESLAPKTLQNQEDCSTAKEEVNVCPPPPPLPKPPTEPVVLCPCPPPQKIPPSPCPCYEQIEAAISSSPPPPCSPKPKYFCSNKSSAEIKTTDDNLSCGEKKKTSNDDKECSG